MTTKVVGLTLAYHSKAPKDSRLNKRCAASSPRHSGWDRTRHMKRGLHRVAAKVRSTACEGRGIAGGGQVTCAKVACRRHICKVLRYMSTASTHLTILRG